MVVIRFAPIAVSYITFKPFTQKKKWKKNTFFEFLLNSARERPTKKRTTNTLKTPPNSLQNDPIRHFAPSIAFKSTFY